jgi:hypothetical protein
MGTDKTKGNGKSAKAAEINAIMNRLAALLGGTPDVAAARVADITPAPTSRPRKAKTAAPAAPRPVPKDHRHAAAVILAAEVPDAAHTASGVAGSGCIIHVRCVCGCQGYLEVPVEDAEVMAMTAAWAEG